MIKICRPVKGDFIITNDYFGSSQWYKIHKAIDIRTKCAEFPNGIGRPILAVFTGSHIVSGSSVNGGIYYFLREADGLEARYYHLDKIRWQEGWTTRFIGDVIGWSGNTGKWTTGAHLHLEFWKKGVQLDPEPYFFNYIENL